MSSYGESSITSRDDLERVCAHLAAMKAPQLPLWRAVADGLVAIVHVTNKTGAWPTKALERERLPVIVLVGDDPQLGEGASCGPEGWACASRMRYWRPTSVIAHGATGDPAHYRAAVSAAMMGGRLAFIETSSRHAPVWAEFLKCRNTLIVVPRNGAPHPIVTARVVH